tara:strand:- start:12969 stop:15008 length:2040 start_codon:yes stop_codon:yes gene_type:complete
MAHEMSELQYMSVLNSYISSADDNRIDIETKSAELTRRYQAQPYGNEQAGQSKIVSNDVQDVVEADMPSLARSFLGANKICVFEPTDDTEENIEEAKNKTEYIDWVVRGQPESFIINHSYLKDIDTIKVGALKWIVEDLIENKIVVREGLNDAEIQQTLESLEGEDVKSVKMVSRSEPVMDGIEERFDIEFKVTRETRRPRLLGVPVESLLFSPGATSEEDAALVGDIMSSTRGDLLQQGFSMKLISTLPTSSSHKDSTLPLIRVNELGFIKDESFGDWASQTVDIHDIYVKIDKDGDGVAERRHILKSGDIILDDEPFDGVPYAITSAILTPHSLVGTSRAELVVPTALIQTSLKRQMLNNGYLHNNPQMAINDNVEEDDLLVRRGGGIVRVSGEQNPGASIFPIDIPYIGGEALQLIQYMEQSRAQTAGSTQASQGLNSDDFGNETATRFNGVQDASKAKIELVARVIADSYRRVYDGIAWLVSEYKTTEVEIMVTGKPLTVDPSKWKHKHRALSKIGLGAGDGQGNSETLAGIMALQGQLKAEGSSLVDEVKRYNAIDAALKAMDIHNTGEFFNNPERPETLTVRENEILRDSVEKLQQMVQQLQNPLAEAETIKAEASLVKARGNAQVTILKAEEDARQFDITTAQKKDQHDSDTAVKLTKIEVDSGQNIEGSIV